MVGKEKGGKGLGGFYVRHIQYGDFFWLRFTGGPFAGRPKNRVGW